MIFIDPAKVKVPQAWVDSAKDLTTILLKKPKEDRSDFIDANRLKTWGDDSLLTALRKVVGNKCWYSELMLEGADPNVDHFRPKGKVKEVDEKFTVSKSIFDGYWWLAFDYENYRLSSMHSNQRRVDKDTNGGKWDFFPVVGKRSEVGTPFSTCMEAILALDPCSISDVKLLWFDTDGTPSCSKYLSSVTDHDVKRVNMTVWLYHLNKKETKAKRARYIDDILQRLKTANTYYILWGRSIQNLVAKKMFDDQVAAIKAELSDESEFAGAKRCAVHVSVADYSWLSDVSLV
ncbi:HNH endonuclease family protein [Pseudomonas sp. S3_H06]